MLNPENTQRSLWLILILFVGGCAGSSSNTPTPPEPTLLASPEQTPVPIEQMTSEQRFQSLLQTLNVGDATPQKPPYLQMGEWEFYFAEDLPASVAGGSLRAAVRGDVLVSFVSEGGWDVFLMNADPNTASARISWLHGHYAVVTPEEVPNAGISEPTITDSGDQITFVGWYEEPQTSELMRLEIVAEKGGEETVTWTPLRNAGDDSEDGTVQPLPQGDEAARMTALQNMIDQSGPNLIQHLSLALKDPAQSIRFKASQAIGDHGDPAGVLLLATAVFEEGDEQVRIAQVMALANLGGEGARAALVRLSEQDSSSVVRNFAANQL